MAIATASTTTSIDAAEMSYRECRDHMIRILETGHLIGVDPDAETLNFVQVMADAGWSKETAYKCRNSAASMSNKISGDARYLGRRAKFFTRQPVTKPADSTTSVQALARVDLATALAELETLIGD